MSGLVPHTITALAESDADGTGGKNIVVGAVVSLFDDTDTAVTLYDDAAGSNGSTSKTTGASGQVTVYVEPGIYTQQVNGSTKRGVVIGTGAPIDLETFAELEALRPFATGQRFICRERDNANYALQPQATVAQAGDLVFANGRMARLQYKPELTPEMFGAKGDGVTDDTDAIQSAIDIAISEDIGGVVFYSKTYLFTTLSIDGNVTLDGTGRSTAVTRLITNQLTGTVISLTGNDQVVFRDIYFGSTAQRTSGYNVLIETTSGQMQKPTFENCTFEKSYIAVYSKTANQLTINDCYFVNYSNIGLLLENSYDNDSGDHSIDGTTFDAGPTFTSAIAIEQKNSGGLRLSTNKFLRGAYHYFGDFEQTGAGAGNTSVLVVDGNSFESASAACVALRGQSPANFMYFQITDNEIKTGTAGNGRCIQFLSASYDYIQNGLIGGNTLIHLGDNSVGIEMLRASNLIIAGNEIVTNSATGTKGVVVGADCDNIKVLPQQIVGSATPYSINESATDIQVIEPNYDSGSDSADTSTASGAVYRSAVYAVNFNKTMPYVPRITITPKSPNTFIGYSIPFVGTTSFQIFVYATANSVTCEFDWSAHLD